jgi:hypothetical protein
MRLSSSLDNVAKWCTTNKLPLNPNKCNTMTFSLKCSPILYPYAIDNVALNRPVNLQDLGVTFDQRLTFIPHIEKIVSSANRVYGFLVRNSRDFKNISTLKTLFFAHVRSKLEYASIVWSPFYSVRINLIESVQRRFLKYISFRADGIYPAIGTPNDLLLSRHDMKSLNNRRDCFAIIFIYKLLNGIINDPVLLGKLNFLIPRMASRETNLFYLPVPRINIMVNSPIHKLCTLCNDYSDRLDLFNTSVNIIKNVCLQ